MIVHLTINNHVKGTMAMDKYGVDEIVQRIKEGFLLGKFQEKHITFNTFYDNEETKDSENKTITREYYKTKNSLSELEMRDFDELQHDYVTGKISVTEFHFKRKEKGFL
ncbi:hypothetical protein [Dokdonia sp. Asnod1-B02]|uniref:hypothetical protein n=1 Tax=Dokdonia sp. Asnod1-B02 TaxID=3160573 RepID=UPI00386C6AD4